MDLGVEDPIDSVDVHPTVHERGHRSNVQLRVLKHVELLCVSPVIQKRMFVLLLGDDTVLPLHSDILCFSKQLSD